MNMSNPNPATYTGNLKKNYGKDDENSDSNSDVGSGSNRRGGGANKSHYNMTLVGVVMRIVRESIITRLVIMLMKKSA